MRSYPLYIDGKDIEGTGWIYTVRSSAFLTDPRAAFRLKRQLEMGQAAEAGRDTDVVGRCARSDDEHHLAAIAAARRATKAFRAIPLETRAQILFDFNESIRKHADEFVDILVAEGHPRRLAQWEVSGVIRGGDREIVQWCANEIKRDFVSGDRRITLLRKPDGVVAVHPPQNAAGSNAIMGGLTLLGGNCLIVKAPRSSPLSTMFVYRDVLIPVLDKHGAPPGTVNLVCSPAQKVLKTWLQSPDVDDLLYFGDSSTGIELGNQWIAAGKKPILELSGNDGVLVWRDANLDAAARALTECFFGSSQICMVPKYAIAHPEIADDLLARLLKLIEPITPGYPEDPDVILSPVLKADRYLDYLAEARQSGAAVLCGGRRLDVKGEPDLEGSFCEPAVVRIHGLTNGARLACVHEETFFPLLPFLVPTPCPCDDELLAEAVGFMNANVYGLRNSLWTSSPSVTDYVMTNLSNGGQLKINDSHIAFAPLVATHGGTGATGGPFGELNYVALRTTHLQGICWGDGDPRPLAAGLLDD